MAEISDVIASKRERAEKVLRLSLEAAWLRRGGGTDPLRSPEIIEVEDFTVTGWWYLPKSEGKYESWGNNIGVSDGYVECWRWSDGWGDEDEWFIDGPHNEMPLIPEEVIDCLGRRLGRLTVANVMHAADCPSLENDDAEFEYEDGHMQCVECGAVDPEQED